MSERWKPKHGELYYYISTTGVVTPEKFNKYDAGKTARCFCGNCFRTVIEAESAAEKFKAFLLSLHYSGTSTANSETLKDTFTEHLKKFAEQPVAECNQLPKLTAEVFDRPDCPPWAKYAAVDENGIAFYYRDTPRLTCEKWRIDSVLYCQDILGKWDATDWQNSLIERPAKLPEWCKVGEWVYLSNEEYDKIESIDGFGINLASGSIINKKYIHEEAVPARLRPYNAEEMKALMGKVLERKDGDAFLVTAYTPQLEKDLCAVDIDNMWVTPDDVLKEYTIGGKNCGVLEHLENGEWVE